MFCPKCGNRLPDDSVFCEFCGTKVGSPDGKKKNRTGVIIIIIVSVLLILAAAAYVLLSGNLPGKPGGRILPTATETSAPTATETSVPTAVPVPTDTPEPTAAPEPTAVPTDAEADEDDTPVIQRKPSSPRTQQDPDAGVAAALSTKDYAKAQDFEWLVDITFYDGNGAGQIVSQKGQCVPVSGDRNALLNGGWKAFMTDAAGGSYTTDYERYFNAKIDTSGEKFDITMNWKYLYDGAAGRSVEENGSELFEGTWNASDGTASAEYNYARVVFDGFCTAPDDSAQYAVGKFYWISGEVNHIGLMRVLK